MSKYIFTDLRKRMKMTKYYLSWNLKRDIDTVKRLFLLDKDKMEVLIQWFGEDNYNELITSNPEGGHEEADKWVRDSFMDSIEGLEELLQEIANETTDGSIEARLSAVGFKKKCKV